MLPNLTAYDPIGSNSGSIDPLGALQTYGVLAEMLLPGVTTVTSRSRYLSMISAALWNAENYRRFLPGASGLVQRRKAVEPFERLWALACVAARSEGVELASDGLRGVRDATKNFQRFAKKQSKVNPDFKMLKYQSRTGAVGTYWTAMAGGELIHTESGALAAEGIDLARLFPQPPITRKDQKRLSDPDVAHRVSMPFDEMVEWADSCNLVAAKPTERELLNDALTADDRRDCVARALSEISKSGGLPEEWQTAEWRDLRVKLESNERARSLGLPSIVNAIIATEQFHESVLVVFQVLLWWGTKHADKSINDLIDQRDFQKATKRCRETAVALREYSENCDQPDVREAVSGLLGFAFTIERSATPQHVVDEILRRHREVQSGKVSGGMRKKDWLAYESGKILRPSPRFQLTEHPPKAAGNKLTHPYRIEQFIYMLTENCFF
ncbi:hypothetical protein N9Z38_00440 [Mariniblastus sp.]|nr:hypothetical protein [Mariniblastus sp.]